MLRQREISALFPADAALNLPKKVYSHGVQLRVAEEVARGSFSSAPEAVEQTTAAHVPKRQVEQVAERAAEDFDAFYAARLESVEDGDNLLVMSVDGKGVVMAAEDLRPATQIGC